MAFSVFFFLGIIGIIVVACKPDNNSSYASVLLSKAAEEKDKSEKELLNVQKLKSYKDLLGGFYSNTEQK